jgi:hypothetical protein
VLAKRSGSESFSLKFLIIYLIESVERAVAIPNLAAIILPRVLLPLPEVPPKRIIKGLFLSIIWQARKKLIE